MELFTIQRYDEAAVTSSPQNENKILKKLLKKVEQRKRKLEEATVEEDYNTGTYCKGTSKEYEGIESEDTFSKKRKNDDVSDKSLKRPSKKVEQRKRKLKEGAGEEYNLISREEQEDSNEKSQENEETIDCLNEKSPKEVNDVTNENFQILGEDTFNKKKKVDVVLPPWLAHPTIISNTINEDSDNHQPVDELSYISDQLKDNLKVMNITKLFPVQKGVIPWLLAEHSKPIPFRPRDICVSAPTGSGKTLAFALPIVQLLSERVEKKIRALVVLPVNELALQVFKVFKALTNKTKLAVRLLSKSQPLAMEQSKLVGNFKDKYYSKVDIVVTTPGRLVEHLYSTKGFCLRNLKFLVIDEADKMMEQVHYNWLYHLDEHVKSTSDILLSGKSVFLCINALEGEAQRQPHKLLFSATLSQDPEKLQNLRLFHPKLFTTVVTSIDKFIKKSEEEFSTNQIRGEFIGKYTTPAELTEKYCITESRLKPLTLYSLIRENNWKKFLCFTNSGESAHRLAYVLQFLFYKSMEISELSSSLSVIARSQVLKKFALGSINGLICSDALARGIDIPEVNIVISYDLPRHIKTYIHRVGRTARAGRHGTAVTLLCPNELQPFNKLLGEAGKESLEEIKIEGQYEESYAGKYSLALRKLQRYVQSEKDLHKAKKAAAKEKANKPPTQMTLMEKLQAQVTEKLTKDEKMKELAMVKDKRIKKISLKNT